MTLAGEGRETAPAAAPTRCVQRTALSSHTYIDGTISSDTIVEKARPPMIARAIG
jgi:hypothetical protein